MQIQTTGRDDVIADEYRYPYEPTPYPVLLRLAGSGLLGENDVLLDYGCGKGRVGFFLSHRVKVRTIGIEYDARIYHIAVRNQKSAVSGADTTFVLTRAEEYAVPPAVNRCYFFNPFSPEILCKVLSRVIQSHYAHPREILLFFYYPSDAYISQLMTMGELVYYGEIDCGDLYAKKDSRERIVIFQLPDYGFGQ
ncbi:MAG: SAM-dependent methyltransferase [Ruminococcaceae bacterium]|nr:SAM-dependent methyltransferase [Oscillospiraceae bacterium]